MTTLFFLGLMFCGALIALVALPLMLLKVGFSVVLALVTIPFQILGSILGGLTRGVLKGMFWLAILMIPLAVILLPFTILAFGAWLVYRVFRPRRPPQAYVVA